MQHLWQDEETAFKSLTLQVRHALRRKKALFRMNRRGRKATCSRQEPLPTTLIRRLHLRQVSIFRIIKELRSPEITPARIMLRLQRSRFFQCSGLPEQSILHADPHRADFSGRGNPACFLTGCTTSGIAYGNPYKRLTTGVEAFRKICPD